MRCGEPGRYATDARGSIASSGSRAAANRRCNPCRPTGFRGADAAHVRSVRIRQPTRRMPTTHNCTAPCAGQARKQAPATRLTRKSPRFPRPDTTPFHTLIHTLTHSPSTPHVDSAPTRRIQGWRQAFSRSNAPRSPPRRGSCRSATAHGPCARRHSGDDMTSVPSPNANAHLDCLSTALSTVDPHLLWITEAGRAAQPGRRSRPQKTPQTTTPGAGQGVSVERSTGLRTSCGPRSPSPRP